MEREYSTNKNTVNVRNYMARISPEQRQKYIDSTKAAMKKKYDNDPEYRDNVLTKNKAWHHARKEIDPDYNLRTRARSYINYLNMRHQLDRKVKPNSSKFEEYQVVYDDFTGVYKSKLLGKMTEE